MYKRTFALILILALIVGCGGSKELKQELSEVKQDTQGTDSTLVVLDARLKEFSQEVKAMRETYNENHISLENLYKLNAESKRSIDELSSEIEGKLASERSRTDSVNSESARTSGEQIAGLQAEQVGIRESIAGLGTSIQNTQFQVDSIYATMDPAKIAILEENLLNIISQFSILDSSYSEFQLNVADHMMSSDDQLGTLEMNARVQDSSNYDILSQLVFLENKIISLTNSFNELMAMPSTTPNIVRTPVTQTPLQQSPAAAKMDYETYKQHYIDALSAYQNGDFMGAIDAFEMLIRNDSQNDYADNAQYWIGESYYALDEYSKAIEAFRKVIQFNDSNKADAAQFKIGYSYLNSGDKARGYDELERLLDMFPESSYREKVKQILASR
ncbi:MAG: tetratricopeptide repeat protein [Candidatus Marinimicrobia bacterium]|jgi:TolA-binding protein|nr:tetratricopeptide repeat protein [Candidatus Neomarinimicrobiota bacterium]MBT3253953.1 tetratricopeptide repeat protein [Candidatus Neomarinimicrobiota bacterium]MBT3576270.1 tetratricopeptide repeat protein [Candidatus Neomarinimicrobiota bacterium]MBT3680813.1 tetratricopeptide repeat protein [Candidatus Neomarinimicrobiota bacterium]MBT3950738.1 tetratricopeptide repeat protein [Candidatus Neomarinimicrobiota bacterium]